MPLRANIRDREVLAFELSTAEWVALKRQLRIDRVSSHLACCGAPAVPKTSKLGTQFFAHLPRSECEAPRETEEHLAAKRIVFNACRDAGWHVGMEVSGPGGEWRADVLATKGGPAVAFEIQWTSQTIERTHDRQSRYERDGIQSCWLFRKIPPHRSDQALPAVEFTRSVESVTDGAGEMPLYDFVQGVLSGQLRFHTRVVAVHSPTTLRLFRGKCPRCAGFTHLVRQTRPAATSPCGAVLAEAVDRWLRAEEATNHERHLGYLEDLLRVSPVDKPWQSAARLAGFCPKCEYFFSNAGEAVNDTTGDETLMPDASLLKRVHPHWCRGRDGVFCESHL